MKDHLAEIVGFTLVAVIFTVACFAQCSAARDCAEKHGVLVKDFSGRPRCIPGAKP